MCELVETLSSLPLLRPPNHAWLTLWGVPTDKQALMLHVTLCVLCVVCACVCARIGKLLLTLNCLWMCTRARRVLCGFRTQEIHQCKISLVLFARNTWTFGGYTLDQMCTRTELCAHPSKSGWKRVQLETDDWHEVKRRKCTAAFVSVRHSSACTPRPLMMSSM